MKFRTADLITRIDTTIAARQETTRLANIEAAEKALTAKSDWLDRYGPDYVAFANTIKDRIRRRRPITRADAPKGVFDDGYGDHLALFRQSQSKPAEACTGDLTSLKAALAAIDDDHVTTAGLRQIGFTEISSLFAEVTS